ERATSSLIASPSLLGVGQTLMRRSAMPPLTIPPPSYEAIAFIRSSVADRDCRSSSSFLPKVLHDAPFSQPLLAWAVQLSRIRPRVIQMSAAGFRLAPDCLDSRRGRSSRRDPLESALARKTAPVSLPPGPKKNRACAVPLFAFSDESCSFSG